MTHLHFKFLDNVDDNWIMSKFQTLLLPWKLCKQFQDKSSRKNLIKMSHIYTFSKEISRHELYESDFVNVAKVA